MPKNSGADPTPPKLPQPSAIAGISRPARPARTGTVSRALTGSGRAQETSAKVNQSPRDRATGVSCGLVGRLVGVVPLLDYLPEAVSQPPATLWSVFARSVGAQGASGRSALAWRWALIGGCASPITLSAAHRSPPSRRELL